MILVRNLTASRVNLIQNDFVSGLPSPFAFLGLVASMAPMFGAGRWDGAVMPVIHSVNVSAGRTKGEQVKNQKMADQLKTLEIPEDIRGTVTFSLLIDFGPDIYPSTSEVGDAILSSRLAGGQIFSAAGRDAQVEMAVPDGSLFRSFRRGRCVLPVEGQVTARGRDGDLEALAAVLFPEDRAKKTGWLVPSATGYVLMEEPVLGRSGTRDPSLPHVFAEPVAGVAELVSPRNPRLTGLDETGLRGVMWRYATSPGRVAAHPFYL